MIAAPPATSLPRVLVFSEGGISRSHGTGTIFERNFSVYPPKKLTNWFIASCDEPLLPHTLDLNPYRLPKGYFSPPTTIPAKVWNHFFAARAGRAWCTPVNHASLKAFARTHTEPFDLVYAIVSTRAGIDTLAAVLDGLGRNLPVILQIQDFFPSAHFGFWRSMRRLGPRVSEIWAVAPSIARAIALHLPGKPVRVDPLFNIALPQPGKQHHRAFGPDFRTVVLGNFWNPALLADLKSIWHLCQQRLPGLPPIRWHCHPGGVARVRTVATGPEPEIEPAPFLSGEPLFDMLRKADLAIIPFSQSDKPCMDYERYSLPSRVTELAAIGVPIFCLTGSDTPLYDYVTSHDIGRCVPAAATEVAAQALVELIRDLSLRTKLGHAARALAERDFPIENQQATIYSKFAALAACRTAETTPDSAIS